MKVECPRCALERACPSKFRYAREVWLAFGNGLPEPQCEDFREMERTWRGGESRRHRRRWESGRRVRHGRARD